MGLSSSKQTTGPSKYAQPYISGAGDALKQTFMTNRAGDQAISNTLRGGIGTLAQKAFGENEGVGAAQDYNTGIIKAGMQTNPQLEAMIAKTRGNVMDNVNTVFSRSGMSGSTGHGEDLGRGLAEAEMGLRYGDYEAQRDRLEAAAERAPGLFAGEFAGVPALLGTSESALNAPWVGARNYAGGIGGLMGGFTTTKQSGGLGRMLLASALQAGASAFGGGG